MQAQLWVLRGCGEGVTPLFAWSVSGLSLAQPHLWLLVQGRVGGCVQSDGLSLGLAKGAPFCRSFRQHVVEQNSGCSCSLRALERQK